MRDARSTNGPITGQPCSLTKKEQRYSSYSSPNMTLTKTMRLSPLRWSANAWLRSRSMDEGAGRNLQASSNSGVKRRSERDLGDLLDQSTKLFPPLLQDGSRDRVD